MNFPVLPGSETFDFAYLELGYIPYAQNYISKVDIKNIGEFQIQISSMNLSEVINMVSLADVTASNYFSLDSSSCVPSGSDIIVGADGTCAIQMNSNLPDDALYRVKVDFVYTLGHKTTPTSDDLITYASSMYFYTKGYNPTLYAQVSPFSPAGFAADEELALEEVFGGDNTDNQFGVLKNTSTITATDIHYIALEGEDSVDLTSGTTIVSGLSSASAPIANYYRLNVSECTGAVQDEMAMNEECQINVAYTPIEEEERELSVFYRYHNGLTYEEDSFKLILKGLKPAELVINNLTPNASDDYLKDFGDQIVEGVHEEFVEITNEGQAVANNLQLNVTAVPFRIEPSDHPDLDACDATVDPDETCYIKLVYNPDYTFLEIDSEVNVDFTWENGVFNSGVPDVVSTRIIASGYAEEKHSQHQGWTSIKLAGFNQGFADYLDLNGIVKPDSSAYQPEELGLVEFTWNKMADEGSIPNPITEYAIYKNGTGIFDIKNDTPIATIPVVGGQDEYTYKDDHLDNEPGSVWYYYVIPLRSSKVSRVNTQDYPIALLRAAIPHPFSVGMHKYDASMQACKKMALDINDPANINLQNNGCRYDDSAGDPQVFTVDYDLHMDMFEAGESYSLQSSSFTNEPGENAATAKFSDARASCQDKKVTFDSVDGLTLDGLYYKDLPNRREHFYFSQKSGGYNQADCEIVDNEIILGDQVDCRSDMGMENMAGGLPEWTLAQVDGYGKGIDTELASGAKDKEIRNIDFSLMFTPSNSGSNKFTIDDVTDPISQRCFNAVAGVFAPKSLGDCNGDHLLSLTSDPGQASPTKLYLEGEEPAKTKFGVFILGQDISDSSTFKLYSVAGGGDALDASGSLHNYSPYTTDFIFSFTDEVGFRCSVRVPY